MNVSTISVTFTPMNVPKAVRSPSIAEIVKRVARETGLHPEAIRGPCRTAELVRARFAVIHSAYMASGRSLAQIGRALGDRDHKTIHHAVKRGWQMLRNDAEFRQLVSKASAWVPYDARETRYAFSPLGDSPC